MKTLTIKCLFPLNRCRRFRANVIYYAVYPFYFIDNIIRNIPVGRMGFPEEIANFVYYVSIDNNFMSGQNIVIDGGYTCTAH